MTQEIPIKEDIEKKGFIFCGYYKQAAIIKRHDGSYALAVNDPHREGNMYGITMVEALEELYRDLNESFKDYCDEIQSGDEKSSNIQ